MASMHEMGGETLLAFRIFPRIERIFQEVKEFLITVDVCSIVIITLQDVQQV